MKSVSYISTALQNLCAVIKSGWPSRESHLKPTVVPFFPYRDEFTVDDGVIMKGHRAVIPHSLHKEYITITHRGHPGVEATKCRARGNVFWPAMSKDITEELLTYTVCYSTSSLQQK